MRRQRFRVSIVCAIGALYLVACGDADGGNDTADTTADTAPDESSDVDEDVEVDDLDGDVAPDDADAVEDTDTVEDVAADGQEDAGPPMTSLVDAGLDPENGWQPDHWDVEVPDEAGTGVLVLGGQRYELSGGCSRSGPVEADDAQRDEIGYFSVAGQFQADDADFGVEIIRSYGVPGMGGPPHFLEFDQVTVGVGPANGIHDHWSYLDGTPWLDRSVDTVTEATEPFVRVDQSGVFTAVGTIDNSTFGDELTGDFELGIRCESAWN